MNLWFTEKHTKNAGFSIKVDRQIYSGRSDFQRIDIFESPEFGRFLTIDGYMMLTEKDEFIYHEMIVHVPMCVNPEAKRILVIGGGVIPEGDIPALKAAGIAEVFTPGTPTGDVVNFIKEHVKA